MSNTPDHSDIDALFDAAAREGAAVDALEEALRIFRAAQEAKAQLFQMPPDALRHSVHRRGPRLTGERA